MGRGLSSPLGFIFLAYNRAGNVCYTRHVSSFFFYDLETSGRDARYHRVMQFAGQRTDEELRPIGEAYNVLVRLDEDILPEPEAILITGITPQATQAEGIPEREFARLLSNEIFTPGTCAVGFNNVRFDDEFVRHTLWRNFYDPYEWAWCQDCSRWDLLDVVRMTRALRPEGINWPEVDGKPTNKLELLTAANELAHVKAHDALSDVEGLIGLTRLIRDKQPKLFSYLFSMRQKKAVEALVNPRSPRPFVYSSGRYGSENQFTTVAWPVALSGRPGVVVVYDLRQDPEAFFAQDDAAIRGQLFERREPDAPRPPLKELKYGSCPAVAPYGVLDAASAERLAIDSAQIERHARLFGAHPEWVERVTRIYAGRTLFRPAHDVEGMLYDGFVPDGDKSHVAAIRAAAADDLREFRPEFKDARLAELLIRYKARNFPHVLSDEEREKHETYRAERFERDIGRYMASLSKAMADGRDEYLLSELQLWAQSVAPES